MNGKKRTFEYIFLLPLTKWMEKHSFFDWIFSLSFSLPFSISHTSDNEDINGKKMRKVGEKSEQRKKGWNDHNFLSPSSLMMYWWVKKEKMESNPFVCLSFQFFFSSSVSPLISLSCSLSPSFHPCSSAWGENWISSKLNEIIRTR